MGGVEEGWRDGGGDGRRVRDGGRSGRRMEVEEGCGQELITFSLKRSPCRDVSCVPGKRAL